jgi:hypothetical protein
VQLASAGRASFITGQLPIPTAMTTVGQAGAKIGIPAEAVTAATILKSMGYATGQFGNNHLGDLNEFLPCVHGFDEFFGYLYRLDAMEDPAHPNYPQNLLKCGRPAQHGSLLGPPIRTTRRAALWAQVLDHIQPHADLAMATGGQLAWVMRKNNPQLKQLVDEFVSSHAVGTSYGNTLVRRYLQNTKWVKDSTSAEEMKKFETNLELFQKYSGEFDFDYLMIAAQGYQESLPDQSKKNPSGAVGIMQVIPNTRRQIPLTFRTSVQPTATFMPTSR